MKLLFVQEAVYLEYNCELYSTRIKYETYWDRFLKDFATVTIFARAKRVEDLPAGYHRATGARVRFTSIGYYNGPMEFFKKKREILNLFKTIKYDFKAFVLRVPGPIGALISKELRKDKVKYIVEVVGDPFEVANSLPLVFPVKILFRYWAYFEMKKIVAHASAALFVTQNALQKKYPSNKNAFDSFASNVIISDDHILKNTDERETKITSISKRLKHNTSERIKIGVVGMLYPVKSPLQIVRTAEILIKKGLNIEIDFVGDGPMMNEIKQLASDLQIDQYIICLGVLASGEEIFKFLDSIDLYLQFSKTEGLPRAMIEAMARGLPVISSNVGGIPELIENDLLVTSGNVKMLSEKIEFVLNNSDRMQVTSKENLKRAEKYLDTKLSKKRSDFYSKVYDLYNKKITIKYD